MNLKHTQQAVGPKKWRGLCATLAGIGWLAACISSSGQVTVDTIGGGVRAECGPAHGFVEGNTYEQAQFDGPWSSALDTNGNLWIADRTNSDIEMVSQAGNKSTSTMTPLYVTTETFTTNKSTGKVTTTITTNYHAFTDVTSVAVDPANNLYILLPSPPMVMQVTLATEATSLNFLAYMELTNYPASAMPSAMAVDGNSNVFIAFTNGVIIRFPMVDQNPPPTLYLENYALGSSPAVHYVVTNGFKWAPAGLALRADGKLAVSDTLSNAIYVVSTNDYTSNPGPQLVTGGKGAGFDDGSPYFAYFNHPTGLAASSDGRLIVCDTLNNRLRVIDTSSNTSTLYGTSSSVWTGTCCSCDPTYYAGWVDGVAGTGTSNASGRQPVSVTISTNTLFVTEIYYSLIREVSGVSFTPVNLSGLAPVAVTEAATSVTATNAVWNGSVYAGNEAASYYFEWGTNGNYGNYTATNQITTSLNLTQQVSAVVSNLMPGTTYHFQLVAFNGLGYSYGGDMIAVTPPEAALVVTEAASNVMAFSATLEALVNPEYTPTTVYFQWGTTTNLINITTPVDLTSNLSATQPVSWTLSNLQSGTIYYYQAVGNNSGGTVLGNTVIFTTVSLPPPTLSFSPSNGYYPECVMISVTSSVPVVYYTMDGSTPTTNSAEVELTNTSGPGPYEGSLEWCEPLLNLSSLRLMAANGTSTNNSTVLQGGYPTTNLVGFPQPLSGGTGGALYIPVVVDLQSNAGLQSLEFRVEITPDQTNAPMIEAMDLQPLTPNDFVPLPGPAPGNTPVVFETFPYTTSSNGQGLVITAEGGSSGLNMQGSGVVVMLHLTIPGTAAFGQSYSMNVLYPSGTSDGQQASVGLTTLPLQTLTVSDPQYMVGDSSPSAGYNGGQFGIKGLSDSIAEVGLDNADVNNAIYASVGIRVPPSDSDAYNAMDAWPPDSAGRGGDGAIGLLDWETILGRSVGESIYTGMDTNNWLRYWTNGYRFRQHTVFTNWLAGGPAEPLSLDSVAGPALSQADAMLVPSGTLPGMVWYCEASIGSGTVTHALPGNTYSLPVYVNIMPGYSLAGVQFRSIVSGSSGAPAVTTNWFTAAGGTPKPMVLPGLNGNDRVQAWSFGSFATALENSNYLGTVSFQVPANAQPGACYTLHFSGVDGAPDFTTAYQLESHPGCVWVMSSNLQPASITSDEWKIAFFGSLTNPLAADDVDADGDGAPNWQEYLAGTDPTDAQSCLQFSSASLNTNGVLGTAIHWLTAPGKTYVLESSPSLTGAKWMPMNTNSGDGNNYQCVVTNMSGNACFYQIHLQP